MARGNNLFCMNMLRKGWYYFAKSFFIAIFVNHYQVIIMFVNAIERVDKFTRPIHSILRNYGSTDIIPCASTMFFINDEGYAI